MAYQGQKTYDETLREENISMKEEIKILRKRLSGDILIKTKEDFENKYIEIPVNISKRKLKKIKNKFIRLGIDAEDVTFNRDREYLRYIYLWKDPNRQYNHFWKAGTYNDACVDSYYTYRDYIKISVKEFLKEKKLEYKIIQTERYNCIPNKYIVFYGTDLREIKEDVERSIQGFSYGKPKKFEDAFEAMHWCKKNPMKFISFEVFHGENETSEYRILRYNKKENCFQGYPIDFLGTNGDLKYSDYSLRYILKWKNIREYKERKTDMVDSMLLTLGYKPNIRYTRIVGISLGNINIELNEFPIIKTEYFKKIKLKEAVNRKIDFKYDGVDYKFNGDDILRTSGRLNEFANYLNAKELSNLIINANELVEIMESENE